MSSKLPMEEWGLDNWQAHFKQVLKGDPRRCPHPEKFKQWTSEPGGLEGYVHSERQAWRCEVCGIRGVERA